MALPQDGQTNWGDPLNADINALQAEANATQLNLNNHAANSPPDPHEDRAYTNSLINPIITGVNEPNGFVQLNSSGTIPSNLIQQSTTVEIDFVGGMYNRVFDCVASFEVIANGADMSIQIQTAINACGSAGGGIVWLGPGVFSISDYLVLPSNCHFMMSRGTTLQRIHGVGADCKYMFSNVRFGTSNTPSDYIRVSGGTIDCVGTQGLSSSCTAIFIIQTTNSIIEEVSFNCVFNNPAIELNGCQGHHTHKCWFDGPGSNSITPSVPACRINCSSSSTTPIGLSNLFYNNDVCRNIHLEHCHTRPTSYAHGCHGAIMGTDLTAAGHVHDHIFALGCGTDYASASGNALYDNSQWTHFSNTGNLFFETAP